MSGVMTVSKARFIHGLPFSASVISWTLFLVLLLSSSCSHIHRSVKRDVEESISGRNALARNGREAGSRSVEFLASTLDKEQGYSGEHRSSLQLAEASEQEWVNKNAGSEFIEKEEVLAGRSVLSQATFVSRGFSTLDALQYAEYGAGLLQKAGAGEGSSKDIRFGYRGDTYSSTVVDHRNFRVQGGGSFCPDDSSGQETVLLPNVLRDLQPGESHLVCRRKAVFGRASCYLAYSCITHCFETGLDFRFCHHDGSMLNLLLHSPKIHQSSDQNWLTCSELVASREFHSSDAELGQIEIHDVEDTYRNPAIDYIDDRSVDVYPQEDTVSSGNIETDAVDQVAVTILPVTVEFQDVADKNGTLPSPKENLKVDARNHKLEDSAPSRTEVYSDSIVDSNRDEEKRLDTPAQINDLDNGVKLETVPPRRVSVMSLDEYKRSILEKQQKLGHDVNLSIVQSPKLRHTDESYNYADSSHGAKVLSSNKEAKGPRHIISSDKDKYLRNPCSAEDKYVVLELSEETFLDTVVIANFEFHSANVKDFEVLGSPVYPPKDWILLGRYRAENVRHRQKFSVEDPKLVRYLKLKLLTHWGSEFFCTLSAVEVYGVDVIKNLLDDWIAHEDGENNSRKQMNGLAIHLEENARESLRVSAMSNDATLVVPLSSQSSVSLATRPDAGSPGVKENGEEEHKEPRAGDTGSEVHYAVGGKTPGDSVLKMLMQKVKALESSQSLFYNYLGDMNIKYTAMLSELDKDLVLMTKEMRNEEAVAASLVLRLAELEVKQREERAYMEHKFAVISTNFTNNMEFMRWQIESMERREITTVIIALLSLFLSGLLHFLASCLAGRLSSKVCTLGTTGDETDEVVNACSVSLLCSRSSCVILYLASCLIVLVLIV